MSSAADLATPRGSTIPPASRPGTFRVIELFHSIQGEGSRSGEPATFIRLAGCNLRCAWCDTPYSWSSDGVGAARASTVAEIVAETRERTVVLTGGEPMLHRRRMPELIDALRTSGVEHITVETNATLFDTELVAKIDLWSLSPKLEASGEQPEPAIIDEFLRSAPGRVQLKFVVTCDADWAGMWELVEQLRAPLPPVIHVQPDGMRTDYDVALRELTDRVLADEALLDGDMRRRSIVRVTPQVHRVIWGAAARGV